MVNKTQKLLLCPPIYFDVTYEINPWMSTHNKVNHDKVQQEYEVLKKTYENLGVKIIEIKQDSTLPDMVYATDFGIVVKNNFISANFKYKERKPEAKLATRYLEEKGFVIKSLPKTVFFEGGDLLKIENTFFLGYGQRSSIEAATYLSAYLVAEVIPLELIDPYYFHLDTAFMPLTQDTAVIYPKAFTSKGLETIRNKFKTVIEAAFEDSLLFACNGVVLSNTLIIGRGISEELKAQIITAGFVVVEVPMDEYRKGGGSVRCVTLLFNT